METGKKVVEHVVVFKTTAIDFVCILRSLGFHQHRCFHAVIGIKLNIH